MSHVQYIGCLAWVLKWESSPFTPSTFWSLESRFEEIRDDDKATSHMLKMLNIVARGQTNAAGTALRFAAARHRRTSAGDLAVASVTPLLRQAGPTAIPSTE
jgi:hypothetical protein